MDTQVMTVASPRPAPPPAPQPDLRPTADVAAMIRDPRPDIPLPMPASISQKGVVAQAQLLPSDGAVAQVERVLKPYGVVMLPQGPQKDGSAPTDRPAGPDPIGTSRSGDPADPSEAEVNPDPAVAARAPGPIGRSDAG